MSRKQPEEQELVPYQTREVGHGAALVLAPHPDDEIFGCAGAIVRHLTAGDPVSVVVVTDGSAGGGEEYVRLRQQESVKAAGVLGHGKVGFWGLPDRSLGYSEQLVARIAAEIESSQAQLVYTTSPLDVHPDHRALGLCALEAVRRCPREISAVLYEVGTPLQRPNLLLDISDLEAKKRAAIECFGSQLERQRYGAQIHALNLFRTYTLGPSVTSAEAYRVVPRAEVSGDLRTMLSADTALDGLPVISAPQLPLVSVVVRTIGRATLGEALASIAAQTYARVEVVVVNAAAAPLALEGEWCGRFPLRVVGNKALDRAAAANAGLEAATGELAIFLDDDDWFYPHHLERLHYALRAQRSARAAYAGIEAIDPKPDGSRVKGPLFNAPYDPLRLICANYIPIHAVLFERTLFTAEGCRFDESLRVNEDWDFWIQLSRKTHFVHLPEIGAGYRFPGGSALSLPGQSSQGSVGAVLAKWLPRWSKEEAIAICDRAAASVDRLKAALEENAGLRAHQCAREAERDEARRAAAVAQSGQQEAARRADQAQLAQVGAEHRAASAEAARQLAEAGRHAAEAARRDSEAARHAADAARAEAEHRAAATEAARSELERAKVSLEAQLEAVRSELELLSRSAAMQGARMVGKLSPGLQRSVGRVIRTVLSLPPKNEARAASAAPVALVPPIPPAPVEPGAEAPASRPALQWGDLRRTTPISENWGFERGTPIDRYYCDQFMKKHADLVTGDVLEIQKPEYASLYGRNVRRVDTIDIVDTHQPTFVCDLALASDVLPREAYDCILVPFTFHVVQGIEASMRNVIRALKPGGVLLACMSGFVPLDRNPDFWRLTTMGWKDLADRVWPGLRTEVTASGNALSAVAAMMGVAAEELTPAELDAHDPRFPVLVTLAAHAPRRE